ncbi:MAG: oligoendopeptidase F [Victivallaceae bacterium]|nr:oligoendopeptidase F [Victivallaceae bacterium]
MTKNPALPVWDLDALYSDISLWEKDFARIETLAKKFLSFKGKLADSAQTLAKAIQASDDFDRLVEKVYTFAHLKSDENTLLNVNKERADRVSALLAKLAPTQAWFDPELLAIPDEKIEKFLRSKALKPYEYTIRFILRRKKHSLSEAEEKMLGILSDALGNASDTFEILNDAELDFAKTVDENGKRVPLTHGNYLEFLESADRNVRKKAFEKLYKTYKKFRNTFASTLEGNVKVHVAEAQLRHYDSALCAALDGDAIPTDVYHNLISAVHDHLDAFYRYIALRKEVMKLDKLDMYDIYNPLLPDCRKRYTFDEAKRLVKAALAPLGKEYGKILDRAFAEKWIDAPERKGKRSGAYSSGCFDSYPYLLLNFNGTLNDVFTLAHELGHSLHTYYSKTHQSYHYADYEIFVAEVASTTNEILLFEYLLKKSRGDHAFRAYLYGHLADEIRGTIYRQTMFAEFEEKIHACCEKGIPLSADMLEKCYYELNQLYYGPDVKANFLIALEWARIPHFYYDFYVYKYATGMSAALKLAKDILNGKTERYFGFLSAGGSKDALDIMRDAGVDLSTPAPVHAALDYFAGIVDALKREIALCDGKIN